MLLADDGDLGGFRFLSCDFVEEFDGFSWFFFDIKAEGFGSDTEVECLR